MSFDLSERLTQFIGEHPEQITLGGMGIIIEASSRGEVASATDDKTGFQLIEELDRTIERVLRSTEQGSPKAIPILMVLLARTTQFPTIQVPHAVVLQVVTFFNAQFPQTTRLVVDFLTALNQMALIGPIVLAGLSCKDQSELAAAIARAEDCRPDPLQHLAALLAAFQMNTDARFHGDGSRNSPMAVLITAIAVVVNRIDVDLLSRFEWSTILGKLVLLLQDGNYEVKRAAVEAHRSISAHIAPPSAVTPPPPATE